MKIYTINDWKQTQKQTTSRAANLCASSTLCSARGWSLCLNSGTVESGNRAWIFRDLKSYRRSTEFIEDTDIFPILLIILITKSYWTIFNHMQSHGHTRKLLRQSATTFNSVAEPWSQASVSLMAEPETSKSLEPAPQNCLSYCRLSHYHE